MNTKVQTAAELIDQVKDYAQLERKKLTIDASDRLSQLLSWLLLTLILLGAGLLVFALLILTLVHVLADVLGSLTLAYGIATALCLVLLLLIWARRGALIIRPVTRFVDSVLRPDITDTKPELEQALTQREQQIRTQCNALFQSDAPDDPTLGQRVGTLIDRTTAVYHGATFALGLINLLKGKKKGAPLSPPKGG